MLMDFCILVLSFSAKKVQELTEFSWKSLLFSYYLGLKQRFSYRNAVFLGNFDY